MKQLLFLLLFPCLALAQYQGNAGQKITLGEQTTADGLVWRGRLADTANLLTNKLDTSVYIVLDTGTRAMWYYRASTTPKWTRLVDSLNNLQGQLSLSTKVTGVLPVANGGTGNTTLDGAGVVTKTGTQTISTGKTIINLITLSPGSGINSLTVKNRDNANAFVVDEFGTFQAVFGINNGNGQYSNNSSETPTIFKAGATEQFRISGTNMTIVGNLTATTGKFTAVAAGTFANNLNITSDGTLTTATSDEKYKYNILPINYGLNTILKLKPVNFQWTNGEENDLGFIAQDVAEIIPEAISTNWNSDLLFRYESIIPILTKAIQEQQALIKALEQRILILENK